MARAIPTIGFEAYHHDAIYVYQPNAVTQRHLERAGMTAREVPIADIPCPGARSFSSRTMKPSCTPSATCWSGGESITR
ncbi:hypothetical protein M5E87_08040 [Flavonifractor plautii]|nr:hypothetical protein M5E87_08040 [Flavonifractor plautii]